MYNQYKSKETVMACSIVSLLHIMLYRYWITVYDNFIIRTAIFFDKLWKFDINRWATFSVIDYAFVVALNRKLDLKFQIKENTITNLETSDTRTYQLWVINYSTYKFRKALEIWEWKFTKESIDYLAKFTWTSGHALNYDLSGWWYIIDTNWNKAFKMSLAVLKYWYEKNIFRNTIRTIETADSETKAVTDLTIQMFQAEKRNKLESFYKKNIYNKYLQKAKKLYFFGR